jgi:hypothetical protein
MPKDPSRDKAVECAKIRAVEERLTHVLVWSRKEEIWCYPEGTTLVKTMDVGEAAGPFTRLRGRRQPRFHLRLCVEPRSVVLPRPSRHGCQAISSFIFEAGT